MQNQVNSLIKSKGTQVNRPTKTGIESHWMEEEIMLTGQRKQGGPTVLKRLFLGIAVALGTVVLLPATTLAQEESAEVDSRAL